MGPLSAEVGVGSGTAASAHLIGLAGWFEIVIGVAVLVRRSRALLVFVEGWTIGTDYLRVLAGEPMWEFIERGGSFAVPPCPDLSELVQPRS